MEVGKKTEHLKLIWHRERDIELKNKGTKEQKGIWMSKNDEQRAEEVVNEQETEKKRKKK